MAGGLSAEAEVAAGSNMTVLKHSSIEVRVEEALADLLVVSYRPKDADILYQGVLLHSNKTNLPYGVASLHPAFSQQNKVDSSDDRLFSVSQRFAYQDPEYSPRPPVSKGKPRARQKMTVRLRPRKVLCSKCQGICNENSESVDAARKRKLSSTNNSQSDDEKNILMGNSLIPKLSRLQPIEISNAINGSFTKSSSRQEAIQSSKSDSDSGDVKVGHDLTFVDVSSEFGKDQDDIEMPNSTTFGTVFSSARTLKICFGAGEGTVLKLPANVGDFNEDSGVSSDVGKTLVDSKAAKRALKKAKKQAKKNTPIVTSPVMSPVMSPRHMGALSPRNNVPSNTPPRAITDVLNKRHRHKVKHKKKRRIERQRDENTTKPDGASDGDDCSNQKLSISLKRLNRYAFVRRNSESGSEAGEGVSELAANVGCDSSASSVTGTAPGDVVWGKLVGHPWWPGKVLSVSAGHAQVAWYAVKSTSSLQVQSSSVTPFLENFKARFNKKKTGVYKEAVRLATLDARRSVQSQEPLGNPSGPSILPAVSPRTMDVF